MAKETPFEANYEKAKQSIIAYIGQVTQVYDIPATIINNLVYEIALESRVNTMSMILAGCEVEYSTSRVTDPEVIEDTPKDAPKDMPTVEPYIDEEGNAYFPPHVTFTPKDPADMTNAG